MPCPQPRTSSIAEAAWRWVLDQVRYDEGGPWIPYAPPATEAPWDRDGMHSGIGGLAHALAAVAATRPWTDDESALAAAIGERLRAVTPTATDVTYFDGLVSHLQCLVLLGEPGVEACVDRLLELAPDGWPDLNDATLGTAAIVLGGLTAIEAGCARGAELAAYAADRLLAEAEETPAGLNWLFVPRRLVPPDKLDDGRPVEMPNWSHGLAGIAAALARAGVGPGPARPGRGLSTRRRAPGHARRPGLAGRRRPRPAPAHPAQARPRRVHVELVPRPGRHPGALRGARRGRCPRRRGRAADGVGRALPALAAHVGHPRAPLAGLLGQRRPLLRHRRRRLRRATSRPGLRVGCWPTTSSTARTSRATAPTGGSPSTATPSRCSHPASAGCRVRRASPGSCSKLLD